MDREGHAKNIDKNGVPRKKETFLKRGFLASMISSIV